MCKRIMNYTYFSKGIYIYPSISENWRISLVRFLKRKNITCKGLKFYFIIATNGNASSNYSLKLYIRCLGCRWIPFLSSTSNLKQRFEILKTHTSTIFNRTFFTINQPHNDFLEWLTSSKRSCLFVSGLKLALAQANDW